MTRTSRPRERSQPPARSGIARPLVRAIAATWCVLAIELVIVLVLKSRQVTSVWEAQFGALWLAPTVLVASATLATVAGFAWALVEHAQVRWIRVFLAFSAAGMAGLVAWGVGGGRHLSEAAVRAGFAAALAAGAGAGAYWSSPTLAARIRRSPARVAVLSLLGIVVLELLNRFTLVRLYPAFHLGLSLLTVLLVPGVLLALPTSAQARSRPALGTYALWAVPVLVTLAAVLAKPAAQRLALFDNFRLVLLDEAPLLGNGVRLAAELSPPPPVATGDDCMDGSAECGEPAPAPEGGRGIDWSGRSLLLVTIDALRADHVGSYGYSRRTTPNIDALAKRGVLFERAYAATPHTSYSVTSIMTGKYMRPLLLQGAGHDSVTWAGILRTYGYKTAGFYPPAVFFIDAARFESFSKNFLGFEYRKVEFLEGQGRIDQVRSYLESQKGAERVFVWVHLFGPHEPYEVQPGHDFGTRDIDRYDSELAAADASVGKIVALFDKLRPNNAVMISADHGEEFGDHGGRYHGTTVYEEQVRVPLVVAARGAIQSRRVRQVVQTIDLLPSVLAALQIPRPPRLRGRDLGPLLAAANETGGGLALAETEEQSLLAEGELRLICARKVGACKLFDLKEDPRQLTDASGQHATRFRELRQRQRELSASHGRYEQQGLRAEGKGWPAAILRGAAGDGDAAEEIAALLDDADLKIRRKAAELLFELARPESAPALRLALSRDEDPEVRRWCAIALTRLGQGAPLAYELVKSDDEKWRRLAALALGQVGDKRGEETLITWWRDERSRDYTRSRELLAAFAAIRSKDAVYPLTQSLNDVRLRPHIAETLAEIGDEAGRGPLASALKKERYQSARVALARALVELKAEGELIDPLVRFLGVPDPLPDGLDLARRAKVLEYVGGPDKRGQARLIKESALGVALTLVVPRGGNGKGVRAIVRARNVGSEPAVVRLGARKDPIKYDRKGLPVIERNIPRIDSEQQLEFRIPPGSSAREVHAVLPATLGARPRRALELVLFADRNVEVEAVAVVPLADELPPPPREPWLRVGQTSDSGDPD
ncbi:MAG TPA: sulfatase-like hydrolase/transferase [Polyangiaceae bacterium]|nr:sulfatase-like hydrolase/transferase [Polyangiaceae bacterium]